MAYTESHGKPCDSDTDRFAPPTHPNRAIGDDRTTIGWFTPVISMSALSVIVNVDTKNNNNKRETPLLLGQVGQVVK